MPSASQQLMKIMAVERGHGPPDKNNEIELETGIGLTKLKNQAN